ncbi:MAG: arylamine N-acetyltransferase [Oscillospiraceae bacterium]|nr:arylamine N-acetyltransferase [Oscillospiraceae bacterium]
MATPSPFEGLYAPVPDVAAYLQRIGFDGTAEPTPECLKKLVRCHLFTVPFENLDIFHGHTEPSLETTALFDKIVTNRRGGYCFELNGLFCKLLEAIGFCCFSSVARIMFRRDYTNPIAHRVILVDIGDKRYFCDVGFGGPCPTEPLEICFDKVLETDNGKRYRFSESNGNTVIETFFDGDFTPLMAFYQIPFEPVDFVALNSYCASSKQQPFLNRRMVHLCTPDGKISLDGDILRINQNGVVTETSLTTEADLRTALASRFGIVYNQ